MHKAKKHLGQNFLHDQRIIQQIVHVIAPQKGDVVIEIGPGLGALTQAVLPYVGQMDVIELDKDVIPRLQQVCSGLGELRIHNADALTYDFNPHTPPLRIIGNLPYNISSPLLFHLMHFTHLINDMHFMLQKEMVDRMAALPDSADYGRLTVMLQYHCQIESLFNVPPQAFRPVPRVDSAVVRLIPHHPLPFIANDYLFFAELVKQAFSQRRKTLRNCLKQVCQPEHFVAAGIDPQWRAEVLSVADFVRLANVIAV
ncbi:MAG: 16S rRNA (adenine(1518)-N(6)/adenine(1519)-N(6))-dimethyltransferase RsmA [Legionellales bacterium]|nr:16S rRNA (adenine(1518)-N(6)/adenine(1519)-N(6))-dimethyltransferase RsmA [Legionellales bacterium]